MPFSFPALSLLVLCCSTALAAEPTVEKVSFYGFLLPTWTATSAATESFSQPNLSAFTAAANPLMANSPAQARSSFQVAQSRLGLVVHPVEKASGRIEFDFIDFSKATPTTASLPRLRRAVVDIAATSDLTLRFGQDWDLISPLAPHSFNFVAHGFESGDIAFMRIQAQALLRNGSLEHAIALGMPSNNNSAAEGALELGGIPTIAWRESWHFSDQGQLGFSALVASLRTRATSSERYFAGAATAFVEVPWGTGGELRAEAYYGQNVFNLGMLGLGYGGATTPSIREAGAYVTARAPLGESFAVFAGAGGAWTLNPADVQPSYTIGSSGAGQLTGTGPGIEKNIVVRAGGEWKIADKVQAFAEFTYLATRHHLRAADAGLADPNRTAFVSQIGTLLTF